MGLGPIIVGITADVSKFASEAKAGVNRAAAEINLAAQHLGKMAGEAITAGVTVGLVALGATIAASMAGAAYAFSSFVQQGLSLADTISDTAAKLGVGSDSLLLFGEAAKQTGTDVEAVQGAMSKLNIKIGEALTGNATAIDSFNNLGLSVNALQAASPEQRFQMIADAIGRIPDPAIRAAAAMDVLGKSGANIVASLGDISSKSLELTQYWIQLGGTITAAQINAAGEIQDKFDLMHAGLDRFKILLAVEIAPYLAYTVETLEHAVKETGGLGEAAKETGGIFGKVVAIVARLAQGIYGVGKSVGAVIKLALALGDAYNLVWDQFWLTAKWAFNKVAGALAGLITTAIEKFRIVKDAIGLMFYKMAKVVQDAILGVFNGIIKAWNAVVDATGLGSKGNLIEVDASVSYTPTESSAGPAETALKKFSDDQEKAASANFAEMKKLGEKATKIAYDIANSALLFGDGVNNVVAAVKGGPGSWAEEIAKGVEAEKAKAGKMTNQQLIDEYNKQHSITPSTNVASPAYGVQLPPSANYNTQPVSSFGPPVTVNQQFATGVSAQDLRQAAAKIKSETLSAVTQKVAAGGNYRREIQC
jgi:hypothetical protein